jgi:hypothetical protein
VSDAVEAADSELFQSMLDVFGEIGGVEIDIPQRRTPVRAADLPD